MIKSELVQIIATRNPHLFLRDVENIVSAVFDEITDAARAFAGQQNIRLVQGAELATLLLRVSR